VLLHKPAGKCVLDVNIVLPDVMFISGRLAARYPKLVIHFHPYQSEEDEATHEENIEVFLKGQVFQSVKGAYVHDQFFHVIRQLGHIHELSQDVKVARWYSESCAQVNKEIKRACAVVAMMKEDVKYASFANLNFAMLKSDFEKLIVSISYKIDIMTARRHPKQSLDFKYNGDTLQRLWSTANGEWFWTKSFNEPWSESSVYRLALLWDRLLNYYETKVLFNRITDDFQGEKRLGLNEDILSVIDEIAWMPVLDAQDDFSFAKRLDYHFLLSDAFQAWWREKFPTLSLAKFIDKRDEIWDAIELFKQDVVRPSFMR
jgi:hypothetical protein